MLEIYMSDMMIFKLIVLDLPKKFNFRDLQVRNSCRKNTCFSYIKDTCIKIVLVRYTGIVCAIAVKFFEIYLKSFKILKIESVKLKIRIGTREFSLFLLQM